MSFQRPSLKPKAGRSHGNDEAEQKLMEETARRLSSISMTVNHRNNLICVAMGLVAISFVSTGIARFSSIPERMSTVPSGVPTLACGAYISLLTFVLAIRSSRFIGHALPWPWGALVLGIPAVLFLATAIEYAFIPFPVPGGASPGFWDSNLDGMIDQDGQVAWTLLAFGSCGGLAVLLSIWLWPLFRRELPHASNLQHERSR
jgi:hypothetical protein